MEDFSKLLPPLLNPIVMWLIMKKDCELPWAVKITRWLGVILLAGYVLHCLKEWFL